MVTRSDEIRDLQRYGMPLEWIGSQYDITVERVQYLLGWYDLRRPETDLNVYATHGPREHSTWRVSTHEYERRWSWEGDTVKRLSARRAGQMSAVMLRLDGFTAREIAAFYGASRPTVSQYTSGDSPATIAVGVVLRELASSVGLDWRRIDLTPARAVPRRSARGRYV